MDLPARVQIHNSTLKLRGGKGTLMAVDELGYYEVKYEFNDSVHRVLLPIAETVIVFRDPELEISTSIEIER